jgi:hypothetical protein
MNTSLHQMQRYVVGGVVVLTAFAISLPIAMARVSQTKKFPGQSVKSETCQSQQTDVYQVVSWWSDCRPLTVAPKPKSP